LDWFLDMSAEYGDIYKIWYGPFQPEVVICHPDLAKEFLRNETPKPLSVMYYGGLKEWLGMGLVLSEGKIWQRNRHLLTSAFHFNMLKTYTDVINQTTDDMVGVLTAHAETGASFDVFKPAGLFALDTVLQCVFSFKEGIQHKGDAHPIVQMAADGIECFILRSIRPYLWPDSIFYLSTTGRRFRKVCKGFHEFARNILNKRRAELLRSEEGDNTMNKDFLDIMFSARDENGIGMNDDEIEDEIKTFLFAGHDTTSAALSWALYALATNPEHQKACRKEICDLLRARKNEDDNISYDDLSKLNYLTMVIKESMRLYSTVPIITRCPSQDIEVKGHVIPKGCNVLLHLYVMHHNPGVWPEPDKFIPDRFHPDIAAGRNAYNFVPFSAGPRNCIGQNFALNMLKVVLAKIINRFEIRFDASHPLIKRPEAILKAEKGIWLNVKRVDP
jgi:cytochrome P450